ncbi:cytosine deaminase [Lentilactobacillus kosonis]|uniref:Cytosine deaminase n=1 Tax=Lentilactobacillus kosonis TaxID=2810561 RepID=A0A401FML2_9LACO|nr:cytosine deaminase [Lentilactobacillus kosonis]
MLIKNVHIQNAEARQDVRIEDGKFAEIAPKLESRDGEQVIDATDKLLCHHSLIHMFIWTPQ